MSKQTVTRIFVAAVVAVVAGLVLCAAALVASHSLVIAGVAAILAGTIAAVVSWVGALLNTWQLDDKTWFGGLLASGLLGLGVVGMVAYVVAGPDEAARI
jgi:hypothetical protein